MEEWKRQFPQDVADEVAFFAQKRAERRAAREDRRRRKAFIQSVVDAPGPSTLPDDDRRWEDYWTDSDDTTTDE